MASPNGLSLQPLKGADLTVGGELDKLAVEPSLWARHRWPALAHGWHRGLKLGEEVAIRILEELNFTGNDLFSSFSLRRFDIGVVSRSASPNRLAFPYRLRGALSPRIFDA